MVIYGIYLYITVGHMRDIYALHFYHRRVS
jgi:hypothetical protein